MISTSFQKIPPRLKIMKINKNIKTIGKYKSWKCWHTSCSLYPFSYVVPAWPMIFNTQALFKMTKFDFHFCDGINNLYISEKINKVLRFNSLFHFVVLTANSFALFFKRMALSFEAAVALYLFRRVPEVLLYLASKSWAI